MLFLKQSTAAQNVLIGPFVDKDDGNTQETGLTIANTDIRLSKNGGNLAAKNSGGGTHDEEGWYQITFDATDTDTVGRLQVFCHIEASALPVFAEFQVLEEAVYDALFAASANTFTGAAGSTTLGAGVINAAALASDTITAAKIAADAIGASELATDAVNEIVDQVWDEAQADHVAAGSFGEVATETAAILADTGTDGVVVASLAANSVSASALATDAVNEIVDQVWDEAQADHVAAGSFGEVATETAAILVDTGTTLDARIPAALVGGRMSSDAVAISGDTTTADNLQVLADGSEVFLSAYQGPRGPGVHLNDAAANTNTVSGVDGTVVNPVSTIAAAKTIADAMSIDRIYLVNDSAITLAATMEDYEFVGIGAPNGNTIALASQDVDGSSFYNVSISGVQGGTGRVLYEDCIFGTTTVHAYARRCGLSDAVTGTTLSNNDDNVFDSCYSVVSGNATPIIIGSAANLDLSIRHYSGGIELKALNPTATISLEGMGQVIFNADCNVGAVVTIRGLFTVTDNTAGMAALTEGALVNMTKINAEVDSAWTTQMADSTVADGTIPTREQAMLFLTRFLTEFGISGTTMTVNKEDGTTAVATFTLDDATNPTSLTRAT